MFPSIWVTRRILISMAIGLFTQVAAGQQDANPEPAKGPMSERTLGVIDTFRVVRWENQIVESMETGKYDTAITLAKKVADLRRVRQGSDHWETFDSERLVIDLEWESHATPQQRQALAEADRLRTEMRSQYEQGKYDIALESGCRLVELNSNTLPANHPKTARSLHNLGLLYLELGRYSEAESHYQRALQIREQVLPPIHPDIASTVGHLAALFEHQGRYVEAESFYRRALEVREQVLAPGDLSIAESLNNLASLYCAQSRYAEAEPLLKRGLEIFELTLPAGHPTVAKSLNNLALLYDEQGRSSEAESIYKRAISISQQAFPQDHPDVATNLSNLGLLYHRLGRYSEAEPLYTKALKIFEQTLPAHHPDIATSISNLAGLYTAQGRYAEAEPLFKRVLESYEQTLPPDHPDVGRSLHNLAGLYNRQERYADAQLLYHRALKIYEQAYPASHPNIAASLHNLADTYCAQGDLEQAEPLLRRACEILNAGADRMSDLGLARSQSLEQQLDFVKTHTIVLQQLERPQEAWAAWESMLARGLLDELAARRSKDLTAEQLAQLRGLAAQLQVAEKQWTDVAKAELTSDGLTIERAAVRQFYLKASADLAEYQRELAAKGLSPRAALATLDEVQSVLPQDAALIGWLDAGDYHLAMVVRRIGAPQLIRLVGTEPWPVLESELAVHVDSLLRQSPPVTGSSEIEQLLDLLRMQRWEPLREYLGARDTLPTAKHVIVLGHDDLLGVPIELLAGDELDVCYCPSASLYYRLITERDHGAPSGNFGLLALGDPVYKTAPANARAVPRPTSGVMINELATDGSAAKSGITSGDIIFAVNDQVIQSSTALRESLADHKSSKQQPRVKLWRGYVEDDQGLEIEVVLGEGRFGAQISNLEVMASPEKSQLVITRGDYQLARLPGTRGEVRTISRLFHEQDGKSDVYLGWQAANGTLAELQRTGKLRDYTYLHLATHGVADARGARLVLSMRNDMGELSADDVLMNWDLNAEQVVLSACQSARGKRVGGEGFMGFAQALLIAGARSVVLSLWEVDDQATTLLMQRYYQNLLAARSDLSSPMPKAEALREAKLWLRNLSPQEAMADLGLATLSHKAGPEDRPFDHPSYWSAFILIGDPR